MVSGVLMTVMVCIQRVLVLAGVGLVLVLVNKTGAKKVKAMDVACTSKGCR